MALMKCWECGHTISTEAYKCPNCGLESPQFSDTGVYMCTLEEWKEKQERQVYERTHREEQRKQEKEARIAKEKEAEIEAAKLQEAKRRAKAGIFPSLIFGLAGALFFSSAGLGLYSQGALALCIVCFIAGVLGILASLAHCAACIEENLDIGGGTAGCLAFICFWALVFIAGTAFEAGIIPVAKTTESIVLSSIAGIILLILTFNFVKT